MGLGVFESPGREWDDFVSRHTDLIFYQSLWSEVLRQGLGGKILYFYLKEGDRYVAGLPSVLLRLRGFKILYASLPYGNVVGERGSFPKFMELLDEELRRRQIDQLRVIESPFFDPYRPVRLRPIPTACTLLSLRGVPEEDLWNRYPGEVRRAIRKARKNGLTIRRATHREEMNVFYGLYLSSMARNRTAGKYPYRWFQALYDCLILSGKADIVSAMKEEVPIAGVLVVYSSTSNHYLHNGSDPAYLQYRPNDLIVDHLIHQTIRQGKEVLDFMGSDINDLSLIRFKKKWGGRSVETHTYTRDYHPLRCRVWEMGKRLATSWPWRKVFAGFRGNP
jgi:hypothetical protein